MSGGTNPANPANALPMYNGGWPSTSHWEAAQAGLQIKTGVGVFGGMNVDLGAAGTATFYDGTDNSGRELGAYSTANAGFQGFQAGLRFATGLFVITSGTAKITVGFA